MSDELKTAIEAAKVGAAKALEYFDNDKDLKQSSKSDNSLLTIADPATEEAIKNYIYSKNKEAKIVGEETGGSTDNESFWVIDPIDGTRIYARGINAWAVLIAYYTKGEFRIGVCYFPVLNELYYAEKGKGAYLNNKKISVSKTNPLNKALINSGNPRNYKKTQIVLDFISLSAVVRGYETTYAHSLMASGKIDASVDPYAQLWDYAPFVTMIQEAGGKITNLKGKQFSFEDRGLIASNGLIHNELVKILNN